MGAGGAGGPGQGGRGGLAAGVVLWSSSATGLDTVGDSDTHAISVGAAGAGGAPGGNQSDPSEAGASVRVLSLP